ncbi:hypothetical protein ACA40_14040 [Pseudomonas syringae pv. lapsa]|nr:hypothetical protein [Pseudomonas syringae]ALU60925.1 hypothetical protein ACA40_14040 [Pseudomonas syringae pv. lapsa]KPX62157.1 Uncharacterized protein ALO39_00573 [Pseudomonas syringae pv. lapsa]RML16205.1 hypothetical protein ALQ99_01048 [Pseudomonas syringae pv. lapsa]
MSAIKECPILFSAPMVRAILEGRKTVTRREVKKLAALDCLAAGFEPAFLALPGNADLCPYGKVGDQLWVQETWYCDHLEVMRGPYLKPDDLDIGEALNAGTLVYAADGLAPYEQEQPTWKPSIHMPRWVSRILLEITDVRVERLQDISEEQAKAEGVRLMRDGSDTWVSREGPENLVTPWPTAKEAFRDLWESINGSDSWDANPWVWAITFGRVEQ